MTGRLPLASAVRIEPTPAWQTTTRAAHRLRRARRTGGPGRYGLRRQPAGHAALHDQLFVGRQVVERAQQPVERKRSAPSVTRITKGRARCRGSGPTAARAAAPATGHRERTIGRTSRRPSEGESTASRSRRRRISRPRGVRPTRTNGDAGAGREDDARPNAHDHAHREQRFLIRFNALRFVGPYACITCSAARSSGSRCDQRSPRHARTPPTPDAAREAGGGAPPRSTRAGSRSGRRDVAKET